MIFNVNNQVNHTLDNFDENLSKVLKKHEYEYMLAYNFYVKKKEIEIKDAITKLGNNSNSEIKDLKIQKLEKTVSKLQNQLSDQEKLKENLRDEIKSWKKKYEFEKQEHEYFHNSALENKRKTKLLKVAVSRLQLEYDKLKEKY